MANLIITIISIALVAVAALMGAYYGGEAFIKSQTKAKISQVISAYSQVAAAWHLHALNNSGSYAALTAGNSGTRIEDNLVPTYLGQSPSIPIDVIDATQHSSNRIFIRWMGNFWQGDPTLIDMAMTYTTKDFCIAFAKDVGKDNNDPERTTTRDLRTIGIRPVDCYWHDVDGDSVMDDIPTDRYVIAYEVH
ncbi:MAG TPA: hypothetical protein PKW15_02425 [Alphaproteobacteria bacterium]|mgnify:CR=1 FL=1|nr:hypothetical protein [Rhodospirillaceae bacterium]HRJ12081.1 hypothetical protein [Alphaproteobacteria bacterium]